MNVIHIEIMYSY